MDAEQTFIAGHAEGCHALRNSNAAYHGDTEHTCSTSLKEILRSPAHYRARLAHPPDSRAMQTGSALHAAVLEPEALDTGFAVWDGPRRGRDYDAFLQASGGRSVLSAEEMENVTGMREAIFAYELADLRSLLSRGTRELSIYWRDERTGVKCRARPDCFLEEVVFDLKKTQDARPGEFARAVARYGYDFQAAFYLEGLRRFTGRTEFTFVLIAVEEAAPHGVWLHELSPRLLGAARLNVQRALALHARCAQSGDWPGYPQPYSELVALPRWARG
jgi:exodeoxyribonuclease VIII